MKFSITVIGSLLYFSTLLGSCPVQILHPKEILWEGNLDTSYMQVVAFEAQALCTEPQPYFLTFSLGKGQTCSQRYLFNEEGERVPYQLYTAPNKEGMLLDMDCGPVDAEVLSGIAGADSFSDREYLYYYFSISPWNQVFPTPGCYKDDLEINLYEGNLSQWTTSYAVQEVSFVMWMPAVAVPEIYQYPNEATISMKSNTGYKLALNAPHFNVNIHPQSKTTYKISWEAKPEKTHPRHPYIQCILQIHENTNDAKEAF